MKKLIAFGAVIVVGFVAIMLLTNQAQDKKLEDSPYDKENLHPETINLIGNENYSNVATPTEFDERLDEDGDFVAYFFSPTCGYCKEMSPVLMPILKEEGVEVLQYNLLEYEEGNAKYQVEGTPTTIYFKDGKEVDRMAGLHPEENIREFLAANK